MGVLLHSFRVCSVVISETQSTVNIWMNMWSAVFDLKTLSSGVRLLIHTLPLFIHRAAIASRLFIINTSQIETRPLLVRIKTHRS